MHMTHYETLFEVSLWNHPYVSKCVITIVVATIAYIWIMVPRKFRPQNLPSKLSSTLVFLAVCLVSALLIRMSIAETNRLIQPLRDGGCDVVSGQVIVVHQMPQIGHSREEIRVNGVTFEFSDFDLSKRPAYRNTISHGGVLTDGKHVRIHYFDGNILKIEHMVPNHSDGE